MKKTTIEIYPISYLNDYCDAMCYDWGYTVKDGHSDTIMVITFHQEMTPGQLVLFGIDFMRWREDYLKK